MALASKRIRPVKAVEEMAVEATETVAKQADRIRQDAADAGARLATTAQEAAASVSERLKSVGVDTDVMADAAKEQASQLQQLIADELKSRPMRALGVAAAVGLVVGLMTAR
jgi:ElaB/YqjD/DUF883 family membrane-anchored ribosome-binding protein